MKEFERHIEHYSTYWWSSFTRLMTESEWGNIETAKAYLKKYWLAQEEYEETWKPIIHNEIFINQETGLPELVFAEQYSMLAFRGGCLFLEDDFRQLQQCLIALGEKYFVVIENTFGGKLEEPPFRMKFPTDITWSELMSGNYISAVLFEMLNNEYFVFGESGKWGKYSASNYKHPLDLIGFKEEISPIIQEHFKQTTEEKATIREWLPLKYHKLFDRH